MKNELLISSISALVLSCGTATDESCVSSGVLFGDSISAWYNAGEKISNSTGIAIVDLSTPSETTIMSLDYTVGKKYTDYYSYINISNVDLVILRFGTAEVVATNDPVLFFNNIRLMTSYALSKDKRVIIVGLTGFIPSPYYKYWIDTSKEFNSMAQKVAEEYNVPFVDIRSIPYQWYDTTDGIHPTEEYSNKQIKLISAEINKIKCN